MERTFDRSGHNGGMHKQRRKRIWAGVLLALICIAAIVYGLRNQIFRAAAPALIGSLTKTKVSFGSVSLHGGHAVFKDVNLSAHGGERLAHVPRIDVTYSLHDLLPGSKHRYGLRSIVVYKPQITVIHNPDGSYNLPSLGKGAPSKKAAAPLNASVKVVDGSLELTDRTRVDSQARHLVVDNINVDAAIHTDARTTYRASMDYEENGRAFPIHGAGAIEAAAGFTLHHWTAERLPLPQLVNYALNNSNIRMRAGVLENLDARYYGSIAATAQLRGGVIAIQGVNAPVRNVHGSLDVTSAGLTTPDLTATVAGAPVYVKGGVYDLKHPRFRLTVGAHSDVARLKQMASAAAKLPLRGPVSIAMLVEGPVRTPLALISLRSPQITYRSMPLNDPQGTIAFDGKTANVLHFTVRYADFSLSARGRMALQNERNAVEAVASFTGPSGEIPYASSLLPPLQLQGMLLATGDSLKKIRTQGALHSDNGDLAALFDVASNGVGRASLRYGDELAARVALDHPNNQITALVHANGFEIHPAQIASLPGLNVKGLPPVSGTVNGNVLAVKRGNDLGLAGNVDVRNARYASIAVNQVHMQFGGAPGHIVGQGRVSGSLAQLAGGIPASGYVDAPIALLYDRGRIVAQVQNATFSDASIRGVPLNSLSATIGAHGSDLHVYAARARIANSGTAVAAGSIGRGESQLAVSVAHLNLAALHGAGVPLESGYADLGATASGSLRAPQAQGALVLSDARYLRYPVTGDAAFAYNAGTLGVRDATIGMGPAIVAVDGSIGGLSFGAPIVPQYDLNAVLRAADAHALADFAQPKLAKQYIEGSIDANVHVGGSGRTPLIAGAFDVPWGSLHGLAFRHLSGRLGGTPQDFSVQNGHVTVGSTAIAFGAAIGRGTVQANLNAPDANLADFNDYFNAGDTLAGTGRLQLSMDTSRSAFLTSGSVDLGGVRYRRLEIGSAVADWSTHGRTLALRADVGGESGRAHVSGTATLPSSFNGLGDIATGSRANLAANLRNVNLGTWLPMLGLNAPVTGYLDADATARGQFPDVTLSATAGVRDGTVGRVRVQQAQVALTTERGRGEIQRAIVQIPYLTAQGSGTFGFHANDRLQLAVHAVSPDLGKLVNTVAGKAFDGSGALDTTLHISGTRVEPQIADNFTLTSIRYAKFEVPKIFGTLVGDLHEVTLQHGEVDLRRGTILASGQTALHPSATSPVDFNLDVRNVDFSDFTSALPDGYRLAGTMGGRMSVRGTMSAPQLNGSIALHDGYFVGPIDQNPIQKINGTLAFSGTTVAIQALHANVGGGTFAMNGTASVPNFRDLKAATFTSTIVADGAQFNSPKYFRGKVNANVRATRQAGQKLVLAGNVDVPTARIPLTAFWNPHAQKKAAPPPLPIAFNLNATVGNDVRVQSTGVDVGAQGAATLGGDLTNPTLSGAFTSTGGTIDFIRRFTIQSANVQFVPANGIMPYVNAVATTQIANPPTYIALHVSGLAPNSMQIAFDSDPSYSRAQIIGLLSGLTSPGATGGGMMSFNGSNALQNLALGQINTYFTQQLLEPLSASLGEALGLQNLQLTDDFTSGFGFSAAKAFGKHITAVFSQSLGYPQRQSLSIEAHRGNATAFNLTFYQTTSPSLLNYTPSTSIFGFNDLANSTALTQALGDNGFTLTYEHKF